MQAVESKIEKEKIHTKTLFRPKPSIYTKNEIFSNIVYIIVNQGLSKCISFLTITLIIRVLGPHDFGNYSFGLAVVGYSGIFVNFGLSTYGSRQINQLKGQEQIAHVISEIVSFRLVLSAITYIPFFALFVLTGISHMGVLIILNIKSVTDALNIEWYFKGVLKNKYVVLANLLQHITHLAAVLLLYNAYNLKIASIALSVSFIVLAATQILILCKNEKIPLKLSLPSISKVRHIALNVWPFFFSGLFSIILFSTDTIFLKIYTSSTLVGYYNCAHRVIDVLANLRYSIIGVFYPVFAQLYHKNPEKLLSKFRVSFKTIISGTLIITLLINIFAAQLIQTLFGKNYISSIILLKYLVFTSLILYTNTFISALYNAIGFEKKVFYSTLIAATLNIVLNSLLVLKYQAIGAIAATLIALVIATVLLIFHFKNAIRQINLKKQF